MGKLNYNSLSGHVILSPTVLINEFDMPAQLVTNPKFESMVQRFWHYCDSDDTEKYQVKEANDSFEVALEKKDDSWLFSRKARIYPATATITLEGFEKIYSGNNAKEVGIDFFQKDIYLDFAGDLNMDYANMYLKSGEQNEVSLTLSKKIFDEYGILDFSLFMEVLKERLKYKNIDSLTATELRDFIGEYNSYLLRGIEYALYAGVIKNGYEIQRCSDFIENAILYSFSNSERRITTSLVSLYDENSPHNNLYDMEYCYMKAPDSSDDKTDLDQFKPLSSEMLMEATMDESQNILTISAMKARAESRLVLTPGNKDKV